MRLGHCFFLDMQPISENGLQYRATGIVESKHFEKVPSVSGKDYAVVYISPWGEAVREWRSASEITVYEVDEQDFDRLVNAFEDLEFQLDIG